MFLEIKAHVLIINIGGHFVKGYIQRKWYAHSGHLMAMLV